MALQKGINDNRYHVEHQGAVTACICLPRERGQLASEWAGGRALDHEPLVLEAGHLQLLAPMPLGVILNGIFRRCQACI